MRIILIEDNDADVFLIHKALINKGLNCDLDRFCDGDAGLNYLNSFTWNSPDLPRLILLDLTLPRRDGLDVLRRIRSKSALVGVPVGVLTSSHSPADKMRASNLGADRFIEKPSSLDDFLNRVGTAVDEMLSFSRTH